MRELRLSERRLRRRNPSFGGRFGRGAKPPSESPSVADLLVDMLALAGRRGATAADAFVVEDQSFSAQVRLGRVDTVKHAREQHLALRVFVGHSVAAASTSDLSPDSVTRLVDEAVSLARITSPDELSGLPDAALIARDLPHLDLSDATG